MEQLNLFDIKFPVYTITKSYKRIWEDVNVLYIETPYGEYVLDNKNVHGDTLGKRRLQIQNSELYRPRKVYYNIEQFIHSKNNIFIDSIGRCFKYKKTERVSLKYHKVKRVERLECGECMPIVDIAFTIKMNCRAVQAAKWLGILHTKYGYILYETSEVEKKDTWRKI